MSRTTHRPGRVWLTGALAGAAAGGLLAAVALVVSPAQAETPVAIPVQCKDNVTLTIDDATYDLEGTCGRVRVEASRVVVNMPAAQKLVVLGEDNTVHGKTILRAVVRGERQAVDASSIRYADVLALDSAVTVEGMVEELLVSRTGNDVTAQRVIDAVVRGRGHGLRARSGYDARVPGLANELRYRRLDAVRVGGDDNLVGVRRGATQVADTGDRNTVRVNRRR